MFTSFKIQCRHDMERLIDLPSKNYFVKNENSIRLCWNYKSQIRYINLASPHHVAQFLKQHGFIKYFSVKGGEVKMFTKGFDYNYTGKGELEMKEKVVPFSWDEIEFTPGQVLTFAAIHELENDNDFKKIIKIFRAA